MKTKVHCRRFKGFALVVALSRMLLLTLIAIGLLTLSRISLLASNQGMAMAETWSNPLLALMLGDLRKHAGQDRAITATSEILATPTTSIAKPNTTRVPESWWDFNPNAAPGYASGKTSRFQSWLVLVTNMAAAESRDFVTTGWNVKSIEVVENGSLGLDRTDVGKVTVGLVSASGFGGIQGSYGWHVSDESGKARVSHYRDPGLYTTLVKKREPLPPLWIPIRNWGGGEANRQHQPHHQS